MKPTAGTGIVVAIILCGVSPVNGQALKNPTEKQLAGWLKRFPKADTNGDGKLTASEARAFRSKMQQTQRKGGRKGAPSKFDVDPGWERDRFPEEAICYRSPEEIKATYAELVKRSGRVVTAYEKPKDGSLRIVGTGHSFMAPGYQTFPRITAAAGLSQPPLCTHTGGGITGSARYKWEQENGIFEFKGRATPKLLASISNAKWDAMMWGPYYNDRPEYYSCWVDFCLKYNPDMKFYLSDAWPQLEQFPELPKSETELTHKAFIELGRQKNEIFGGNVKLLNEKYPKKVFVMPTSDAMVLAVREYHRGNLPGIEGVHKFIGGKERSLWKDHLGHLGPGLEYLEGYVFYATLYGRSPELIDGDPRRGGKSDFPSRELDSTFRKIAWEAVVNNPLSGVSDKDGDGIGERIDSL